jgi:glycerol-3-phosphate dehydrogenase (NAD(P)+)
MCSVLKNIFAIAAGLLTGSGYGNNSYGCLITLAIFEMHHIMNVLHISSTELLGSAGLGDLVTSVRC